MSTLTLSIAPEHIRADQRPLLFPGVVGLFFGFRVCLTWLFFQANPVAGARVNIAISLALLYGAVLYTAEARAPSLQRLPRTPTIRWIFFLLSFSLISISWTGAQSVVVAFAYWTGMAADVAIVLVLLWRRDAERYMEGIMKGAVWGTVALSLVAWCAPATEDLRLGNDMFLHPNTLGLTIAIATLLAQYLAPRGACWRWLGIALAVTLLRTLSKTSIVAFVIAECWYLIQNKMMSRKTKVWIGVAALTMVCVFWRLLSSYIEIYNNTGTGTQAETLTGRAALWTVASGMGMEKPVFGHGFYSFKSLIPALGAFQPVHAHNDLIQQFFELGIVGVGIVAAVYWNFYRQARRVPAGELKMLALALLIFALLHGLTDSVAPGLSFPLWLLSALSIVLSQATNREDRTS
jgi:O-antigen ligase